MLAAELPALPDRFGFAGSFAGLVGDQLIVAGGANFPDGVMPWKGGTKVWHEQIFSLSLRQPTDGWKPAGKLSQANGYGISIATEEGFLMIGGGNAQTHFATVTEVRNAEGKLQFTAFPSLPVGLANGCGLRVDQRVHVVGGITKPDATTASNKHFVLDLAQRDKGWTEAPPLPGDGVMLATAGKTNDGFVIVGGCSLSADAAGKPQRRYLQKCWHFTQGAWKECQDLPVAAVATASPAWAIDGKVNLIGGDDGTQVGQDPEKHRGFSRHVWNYDPSKNEWLDLGEMEQTIPVTLPAVIHGEEYLLISGEIRPGVRTPAVTRLTRTAK